MSRERDTKRRLLTKAWYKDFMAGKSCTVCGEDHPGVLDWHHRDPSTKKDNIPTLISQGASMATLTAEMDKCDIVCANCHRKIHWRESQLRLTDNTT